MNKRINRLLVGVFCFGAVFILLGFAFFTGSLSFLRENNERFVLVFNENLYGLHEGSKVTFNGVRIGRVERFYLGEALEDGPVPVQIEINRKLVQRHMVEETNEIFDSNGNIKKTILPKLVGQLNQESFVTGILYVNLTTSDLDPISEDMDQMHGHQEIRTKVSIFAGISESLNLEKLSKQISSLLVVATQRFQELDMDDISSEFISSSASIRETLKLLREKFSPLGDSLNLSSRKAQETLTNLNQLTLHLDSLLKPGSDLNFELHETLGDVSSMAKSLKNLADMIERNPQAFIMGKPVPD